MTLNLFLGRFRSGFPTPEKDFFSKPYLGQMNGTPDMMSSEVFSKKIWTLLPLKKIRDVIDNVSKILIRPHIT